MEGNSEQAGQQKERKIEGVLTEKGVRIVNVQTVEELKAKGFGVSENGELLLHFYEALYLLSKGLLDVKDDKGKPLTFNELLQVSEKVDEGSWAKYLVYRDLRGRGYVVRGGFGLGADFRVYERGEYGKDTAKYLILSLQEGKPVKLESLAQTLKQSQNLKKELVLAVMSRRGEIVYYSVSQLTLK